MGIGISYDRVLELEEWIATAICKWFGEDGVVAPACLRKGLFTVGALDNLDHNPSSTIHWTPSMGLELVNSSFQPGMAQVRADHL